jgi:phage gpG-like protein
MPARVQLTFYKDEIVLKQASKMNAFMTDVATQYANEVKLRMRNSPATGKIYRRGGIEHQASAPGEPPAPDSGRLENSVQWRVRHEGLHWFAEVGTNVGYALFLEFGAAKGLKNRQGKLTQVQWILFPRPVWGPALITIRGRIPDLVKKWSA